ncbi:aldo/keto reductase family protein [Aspergillus aculeatinus CBS 121060]|uniref:Aldo/keto reductase n=1 Tax=Aspergillus aculeatinus CBS 121060 TaxID=1448322 RepID=A0ACD1H8V9_9EURO|nr:Aldo/keto reductase [Aspergillus aculeatinus CBS 121060]RAH69948.1 Aldo/keto reductase [Aspergillus aculeatinus CBS 121060]
MTVEQVQLIYGGGSFISEVSNPSLSDVQATLNQLHSHGIRAIDTAPIYDRSEELLGQAHAADRFALATKFPGGFLPEPATEEVLLAAAEESLRKLQTDQIDIYYLHAPDRRAPLAPLLEAITHLHRTNRIRRFGLSNFLPAEVDEVVRLVQANDYLRPTVYQGNYSAIARGAETTGLLDTLRRHGIAFYAYSPIAGGLLAKEVEHESVTNRGRWDPATTLGGFYHALYNTPVMREGLRLWGAIAREAGLPPAELAYRWVVYHSALRGAHGDAILVGARNSGQLEQTLAALRRGPLSDVVAARVDGVWSVVAEAAPLDNYNNAVVRGMFGIGKEE